MRGACDIRRNRDHPRVCGEKLGIFLLFCLQIGSPPRVRGKVTQVTAIIALSGITPACAGKSKEQYGKKIFQKDHPRVCGEKPTSYCLPRHIMGSPPRVRGKVLGLPCLAIRFRITPACAGKRTVPELCAYTHKDHPRVCGEKVLRVKPPVDSAGSPPRVRGKDGELVVGAASTGITPACAGKRWLYPDPRKQRRDHPRVCGEKKMPRHAL